MTGQNTAGGAYLHDDQIHTATNSLAPTPPALSSLVFPRAFLFRVEAKGSKRRRGASTPSTLVAPHATSEGGVRETSGASAAA